MSEGRVVKFKKNVIGHDYVVGDIHGCYDKLIAAMDSVNFDKVSDRLFCVGDLVDRGAQNMECVALLDEPWFFSVRGNHEQLLLNGYEDLKIKEDNKKLTPEMLKHMCDKSCHISNGGEWFYNETEENQKFVVDRLSKLPYIIELNIDGYKVGIVHADIPVGVKWKEVKEKVVADDEYMTNFILWSKARFRYMLKEFVKGVDSVYVGHSILDTPKIYGNVKCIDTGSYKAKGKIAIEKIA